MTLKYKVRTRQTIETINKISDQGISKISVIIRHSDRFFSNDPKAESFMGLTDIGKDFAFDFGSKLHSNPVPKLCSSFLGRCIETAYLIDKGYTKQNNLSCDHNVIKNVLGPLYIKDIEKVMKLFRKQESEIFLRNWFDKRIDKNIITDPEETSDDICEFMIEQIKNLQDNQIALCISHDWNILPVKEFKMNLKHEISGDVGYLDALIFFENNNKYYITNYQTDPILL